MSSMENFVVNMTQTGVIEKLLFSWYDYFLFTFMLGISTAIGIYFGFFGKKQDNVKEYILGGKTMMTFPIGMSLIASDISGNSFIGVPADIYVYGASYLLAQIGILITGFVSYYVYVPVFYKLQLTSCFEYLKLRFDARTCMFGSFLISFTMFLYMPLVVYVPALAFSQVTDINVHLITPVVCVVCIFYTTLGGLRAVVWTDTIQFSMMCIALVFVLILGFVSMGGFGYVFQRSYEGGRLLLWDFDPDPTNRTAFWSPVFGMPFSWLAYVVASQVCNQKLQALPTYSNVKWYSSFLKTRNISNKLTLLIKGIFGFGFMTHINHPIQKPTYVTPIANATYGALLIYTVGLMTVNIISTLIGLIIYAKYADCDPVTIQRVSIPDQLLPLYIMEVAGKIPGVPGIFIAGIFCAALSTMSTDLNTLCGLIYQDFLKPFMPENTTEKRASDIMKLMVVILGVYATGMVHIVEHLGAVYPLGVVLSDMTAGPLLGMFSLGMLVPFANSKGTLTGAICALLFMGWISFGSQYHVARGGVITPTLPVSIESCTINYDTLNSTTIENEEYIPPWIYRLSFYYFCLIGTVVTMTVGVIVSIYTGGKNQNVDRELLSPAIHFFLPKEQNSDYRSDDIVMNTIEKDS